MLSIFGFRLGGGLGFYMEENGCCLCCVLLCTFRLLHISKQSCFTINVTKEIISKMITELNTNKSPGPDNMHPRVVKELSLVIVNPFYYIYTLSIKTGNIPSAWKLRSISAIYKNKGS